MAAMNVTGLRIFDMRGEPRPDNAKLTECTVAYGDQLGHAITLVYVERLLKPSERHTVAILVSNKGSVLCSLEDIREEFHPEESRYNLWIRTADACTDEEFCILFVQPQLQQQQAQFVLLKSKWDDEAKARMQADIGADKLEHINEFLAF
jgi:hypothetical protein